MSPITDFRAQACNNAWANYRLLESCGRLSGEELAATRMSFFPTIIGTLNHILTVDWFYVSALEGRGVSFSTFEEVPCPAMAELKREQRAVDRGLIAVCEALDDAGLGEPVELIRDDWLQVERKDRTLLHLFQHQVHHRGHVHAMLAGTPVEPPQLDEFFLGNEREQALRAPAFAALGFDEQAIWRDRPRHRDRRATNFSAEFQ